jgi:hypothetical protein
MLGLYLFCACVDNASSPAKTERTSLMNFRRWPRYVGAAGKCKVTMRTEDSAAAEKDLFAFGFFKVSHESILVFP